LVKLSESSLPTKAAKLMHAKLMDPALFARDGRITPADLESAMDAADYIGMKNGIFDLRARRFIPKGTVPRGILVSMTVRFDYIDLHAPLSHEPDAHTPDDPHAPVPLTQPRIDQYRARILELYRTLFATDYNDPHDPSLAAAWRFMRSLLTPRRANAPHTVIFLGHKSRR
jgi:hypothetical protein